jgi:soluble lytic murein transglycosylase-like protein
MADLTQIKILIVQTAQQYGIDPILALAVARAESGYNQGAISAVGAIGIFQLMPATASDLGVNPSDLTQNIQGGCKYLSRLQGWYSGRTDLILAGYNWGPGNVNRLLTGSTAFPDSGTIQSFPPDQLLASVPSETSTYIQRVTSYMIDASNDPVVLGLPGSGGNGVDITNSDTMLIAGIVVGVMILFVLLKR